MRFFVVAAGRIKEKSLRAVADDYLGRVRRYARCDEVEVKDDAALAKALPPDALVVALEVNGEQLSRRSSRSGWSAGPAAERAPSRS